MGVYNLGNDRMLCWDDFIIDTKTNIDIQMHHAVPTGDKVTFDNEWDGCCNGYCTFIQAGDMYYLYYRAMHYTYNADGTIFRGYQKKTPYCIKASRDGKHWKNLFINKHEYNGETFNNIFHSEERSIDNFIVGYDKNPNCDPNEKFKALSMGGVNDIYGHGLYLYVSPNGIDFTLKKKLALPGSFDSANLFFWDEEINKYRIYYRGEHHRTPSDEKFDVEIKSNNIVREVRLAFTEDFETFDIKGELNYINSDEEQQLYTSGMVKYPRAKSTYIGFPMRYIERWDGEDSFSEMPLAKRKEFMTRLFGREGTVVTDCGIMFSRDGYNFKRFNEAFHTPGIENRNNWWYGDAVKCGGLIVTESDLEGAPDEYSLFFIENYHIKNPYLVRYTMRFDGFFSWYAKYDGGTVLTKPFTFSGNELEVNFATSAFSGIDVVICDEAGNELDGYKKYNIFGDSINRKVRFEKDLKELEGKPIRIKFTLRDAHLYSFKFN